MTGQESLQLDHDSRSATGAVRQVDVGVDPDEDVPVEIEFDPFA